MVIDVVWKTYNKETINRGYWDQAMLEDIFAKRMWQTPYDIDFQHWDNEYPSTEGIVLVLPARHNTQFIKEINVDIHKYKWVLLILTGDEEGVFEYKKIEHPNKLIWAMTPRQGIHDEVDYFLINGYTTQTHLLKGMDYLKRGVDVSFSGQITHSRRIQCKSGIESAKVQFPNLRVDFNATDGFTKGMAPKKYYEHMVNSKVVVCPSGAVVPDSFRIWEALEAGCIPIVDADSPLGELNDYWGFVLGLNFLPVIKDWSQVGGHIDYFKDTFLEISNSIFANWQAFKRKLVYKLFDDISYLIKEDLPVKEDITVLIPTSPIKRHPDTSIIEETYNTVRARLPQSEIIIMIDGIREEQADLEPQYNEYIQKLLWKCNHEWINTTPLLFDEHTHQASMTRKALEVVKTKCILFVEHDTPLCEPIPFNEITGLINSKRLNVVRLHHEALILDDHKHLMLDEAPIEMGGIPIVRTSQWSQRPHVASTNFYRNILNRFFSPSAKTMIEDVIHGPVAEAFLQRGQVGWNEFKVGIYAPSGDMKRSYHTDGRGSESKFDDSFIY